MPDKFRTAVVVVHGMGQQKPRETVYGFVRTALRNLGKRIYYSRPDEITDSYEARRLLAIERKQAGQVVQTQTEFFEYHWSYMMTGNQFRDLLPAGARLLFRSPARIPWQLLFPWALLWVAIVALAWTVFVPFTQGKVEEFSLKGIVEALFPNVLVAAVVVFALFTVIGKITSSFVDVVRYLDTSPRSYEVRRAIRGGMVDLLRNLHSTDRYSRVVVVAHSLGGFIAYDGLTTFWDQTDRAQDRDDIEFDALAGLETAAQQLVDRVDPVEPTDPLIAEFRAAQLALWQETRDRGINWRITDFITLGTPMYMADMLLTTNHRRFEELKKRAELPQCPPRSDSETVEGPPPRKLMYGRREEGDIRRRLVTGSPFAVVRWSNFWFPTVYGMFGDPFGGSLAPLFGAGIDNRPVTVDKLGRYLPLVAHTRYFKYPDQIGPGFVAPVIRTALALEFPNPPVEAPPRD